LFGGGLFLKKLTKRAGGGLKKLTRGRVTAEKKLTSRGQLKKLTSGGEVDG